MENDFGMERPRVPKLTGPNYRPWSLQVKRLLQSLELWEIVVLGVPTAPEGTATPASSSTGKSTETTGEQGPKDKSTGDELGRIEIKDARASTIIMGACAQPVLQHILLLKTAKEQWDTLKKLFFYRWALSS